MTACAEACLGLPGRRPRQQLTGDDLLREELPEVLARVCGFLDARALCRLACVARRFTHGATSLGRSPIEDGACRVAARLLPKVRFLPGMEQRAGESLLRFLSRVEKATTLEHMLRQGRLVGPLTKVRSHRLSCLCSSLLLNFRATCSK